MKHTKHIKASILILTVLLTLVLAGCGDGAQKSSGQVQEQGTSASADSGKTVLTITGYEGEEREYSLSALESLGTETLKYSGRNKENNNQRQVREYTGVKLEAVLKAAGYGKRVEGQTLKVTCSDGYTREYELESLQSLYFFDGEEATEGDPVPPMLAIIKEGDSLGNDKSYSEAAGSPLRLIYGQADYDSEYTKDFNMQGWASYVERIEVKKSNE